MGKAALVVLLTATTAQGTNLHLPPISPSYPRGIYVAPVPAHRTAPLLQEFLGNPAISGLDIGFNWSDVSRFDPTTASPSYQTQLLDCQLPAVVTPAVCDSLKVSGPAAGDPYDWSSVDQQVCAIECYNRVNGAAKNMQLGFNGGFHTPGWFFDETNGCDWMLNVGAYAALEGLGSKPIIDGSEREFPDTSCKWAFFRQWEGQPVPVWAPLPLPWDSLYLSRWQKFVHAVARRYGARPELVSIAVNGPGQSSSEILMDSDCTSLLQWSTLLASPYSNPSHYSDATYQNSDKIFFEAWTGAIDLFGSEFNFITLQLVTGNDAGGLLDFADPLVCWKSTGPWTQEPVSPTPPLLTGPLNTTFAIPAKWASVCPKGPEHGSEMDCVIENQILSYFTDPTHGGYNAKIVEMYGLSSWANTYPYLGLNGIRQEAQSTASSTNNILGGAGEISAASINPWNEGNSIHDPAPIPEVYSCIPPDSSLPSYCSPEQALFNLLAAYFYGTTQAFGLPYLSSSTGVPPIAGSAPLNFLSIYSPDLIYANKALPAVLVSKNDPTLSSPATYSCRLADLQSSTWIWVTCSFQDLLDDANQALSKIAEAPAQSFLP